MWLRVVGSADALRRVGAATGVQWDVSEELPLGTPEQLERLQRLLGLEKQGFTLHLVRDHMRAEVLSLGQTPWQLGLTADVDVWVEPASPKSASSPSAATAAVAVHPTLEAFHRPNLLFIRFVKVLTDREQEEMRVLVLSTKSLYLAHNNTAIDRWILYNEVREAVVMTEPDGDWVLLRCVQPEHDILLCLIDHHNNIPVHTTGDKLSMVLHHSGVKITPWQRSLEELYGLAHLHLHRGYVDVARKCEMIRNSPLNPSAYASSPPLHPRLDQQAPHDSLQPSVATASPPRDSVKAVPDPPQEPAVLHLLKEQTEMLGVLREEFQALQQRQTEAAKTEETGHLRQLADEVAAMKAQNAELAKHVIVSSTMVGGSPPPPQQQHAAAPPQPQPQPSSGLSKAVVVGVSHGAELPGNTRSAEQALAFLRGVGSAQVEVLSDSPVGGVPCNPPTRDNVVAALRWLAEGAAPGQSLWLSLALQARAGAWLTGDGQPLHPAELQSLLFAALPAGVRLTVMLDGVPAISVMNWSTTGLDLPYCLVCTEGAVSKEEADRKGAPSVHAQVVLLSALQQPKAGVGPSQGQLAGLLSTVFLSELGGARPVNYEQLLQAVAQPVKDVSQGSYLPIVASSFSLSKHTPVSVVPVQIDQPPQPARVVPGFEPSPPAPAPAAAFAPAALAVVPQQQQQPPRGSPPRFPAVPQFSSVEGQPAYNTATTTSPLHSASQPPEIKVPLMAPFVDMDAPVTTAPPVQQEQNQDYWRNLVCHAFKVKTAFDAPSAIVSSSHTGKQARLNKDYVATFDAQWRQQHTHTITVSVLMDGRFHVARKLCATSNLWEHLKAKIHLLLGSRNLQRQMYPHSRDAQRDDNFQISVEGPEYPNGETIVCHEEDWVQAVTDWELDCGFGFTKTSLPVPLMPPFKMEKDACAGSPQDAKISSYLQKELSSDGETAKSVSFEYDTDFVRNLSYHTRLMSSARSAPYFIVEDSTFSHPIIVNQTFLMDYVKAWNTIMPHVVWIHNAEHMTLVAKCRVTEDFWKYCATRGPQLQAMMGDSNVLLTNSVHRLSKHKLVLTSSCGPESLHLFDGVWGTLVEEWEQNLPKADQPWSPPRGQSASPPRALDRQPVSPPDLGTLPKAAGQRTEVSL